MEDDVILPSLTKNENNGKTIIYLAGKIPKNGQAPCKSTHWTIELMDELKQHLQNFDLKLLNPIFKDCDLTKQESVFGRDIYYVSSSDIVFVDARSRCGLGVGAEIMWAKTNGIPVITWSPKNTHYNKDAIAVSGENIPAFIHPFVHSLSDQIVENIEEGANWIKEFLLHPYKHKIKDSSDIHKIMNGFKHDQGMNQELATTE